ncbi:Dam family site-specific DNA-(adenine-N6)-methyltransferase [Apilactobacillus xinyiensis]|uniref:Dam family site-specific DNA-(adenine-N6)-methyltransferase n=1 Tax=Apilactobacillus xinyiensis TaxID=2841032 RepID=UPI0020109CE6|nr:Dam family site-specific DNA-(adenine-N6)-methyltransferase [Apilactobacillus xinyiensis]MCL0330793.1 Dam family site-specific DNA-(adenine-N6)-methyltransferase [Apilactobacillus xinyiensis]
MIKSFLNYPGGKYKLMNQLLPLFPSEYDNFIDMFTGSAVVSLNQENKDLKKIYAYDVNKALISLLRYISETPFEKIYNEVLNIINDYGLTTTFEHSYSFYGVDSSKGLGQINKSGYINLRSSYNDKDSKYHSDLLLYVLIVYGFNNQIRFNHYGMFNNPVGKRDFNKTMQNKLKEFCNKVQNINIEFFNDDFRNIDFDIKNSFYYADPPYLITNAVYNEQNGWNIKDELALLQKLDKINDSGNKFALSNVLKSKGVENETLLNWSKNYNVHHLSYDYKNSSYHRNNGNCTDEVLITNY